MRYIIFLIFILFSFESTLSQEPVKKEVKKTLPDQVPSKNGMQAQMREAINELNKQIVELEKQITDAKKNKEDEETIKSMQEQADMLKKQVEMMGGVSKGISTVSDKTFQQATKDDNNTDVPKKDAVRIKMIPDNILSDVQMISFVKNIHTSVEKLLPAQQKSYAKEVYDEINIKERLPAMTGNVAVLCWIAGSKDMAVYLMGRSCVEDMKNVDNLNNYASFLTMTGAEHAAIPILRRLDQQLPNNSTILNNIGQAWFGLGDMNNATRYLNAVLRLNDNHPEANRTMAVIARSEGRMEQAIEHLKKSLNGNYSSDTEASLNELGYQLKKDDVKPRKMPDARADQLGIEGFISAIPAYPFTGGIPAETGRQEWYDFREKIQVKVDGLNAESKIKKIAADAYELFLIDNPEILLPYSTCERFLETRDALKVLTEWALERTMDINKDLMQASATIGTWRTEYNNALKNTDDCGARKNLATEFNGKANALNEQLNTRMMTLQKQFINTAATYSLYAYTDRSLYELALTDLKIKFLLYLKGLHCDFEVGCIPTDPPAQQGKVLPDFDEQNCQYKTELSLGKYFNIKVECNKMTTAFDVKILKGSLEENLATGKYNGSVEIQVKIGSDKMPVGPIEVGTSVKAGAGVDFTESGIKDIYVTGEAQVKAGPVTAGSVEAKVSVISGNTSLSGKGAFSGVNVGF
jgi:tetratricopeptide (TPR) repeat protein